MDTKLNSLAMPISHCKVLVYCEQFYWHTAGVIKAVADACVEGAIVLDLCEMGDQMILEETKKVYKKEKEMKKGDPKSACMQYTHNNGKIKSVYHTYNRRFSETCYPKIHIFKYNFGIPEKSRWRWVWEQGLYTVDILDFIFGYCLL